MNVDPKLFGAEVRRRRLAAGWTQGELAARARTAANSIARLERGERGASLTLAVTLADVFACRVEDLVRPRRRRK